MQENKSPNKDEDAIMNPSLKPEEPTKIDFNVSEEDLARHREEEKIRNDAEEALDENMDSSPDKNEFLLNDMNVDNPLVFSEPVQTIDEI